MRDPRKEWGRAVEELIHLLKGGQTESSEFLSSEQEDPAKRRDRLQYIEEVAQTLKKD